MALKKNKKDPGATKTPSAAGNGPQRPKAGRAAGNGSQRQKKADALWYKGSYQVTTHEPE